MLNQKKKSFEDNENTTFMCQCCDSTDICHQKNVCIGKIDYPFPKIENPQSLMVCLVIPGQGLDLLLAQKYKKGRTKTKRDLRNY